MYSKIRHRNNKITLATIDFDCIGIFLNILFLFQRTKKVIPVWNDMMVTKFSFLGELLYQKEPALPESWVLITPLLCFARAAKHLCTRSCST